MHNLTMKKSLRASLPLAVIMFAGIGFSSTALANDITHSVRSAADPIATTENYLELGIMFSAGNAPSFDNESNFIDVSWVVNGSYNWNGLFIENYSESGHGITFGYNAFNNDNWSLDLTVTTDWWQNNFDNNGQYPGLNNKDYSDPLTVGTRLTGYLGNNTVQFSIDQDATGEHNGTTVSALIGRNWQVRNWNFHGIVGVEYSSAQLNEYYVGVSAERAASSRFAHRQNAVSAYEAGDSFSFSTELGVTYPISENWLFRATARAATISDELTDSPYYVVKESLSTSFRTSLSYVF